MKAEMLFNTLRNVRPRNIAYSNTLRDVRPRNIAYASTLHNVRQRNIAKKLQIQFWGFFNYRKRYRNIEKYI